MSASGDLGPAPSGVNLSQTQVPSMYGAIITTAVAGTLAVICRFYARITFGNPIGADDLLIICALIFTWGTAVATFVAIPSGMGRHLWVLTLKDFDKLWQNLFAYVNIYVSPYLSPNSPLRYFTTASLLCTDLSGSWLLSS